MNNNNTQNNTQNSSENSSQNSKNGNQSSSLNSVVNWKKYVLRKLLVCIPLCLLILLMYHVSEKGRKYNGNAPLFGQRCIFGIMSTVASIQLYGPDRKTFQEGFEEVQTSFQSVEKLCNIFQAGSELSRLNATAFEKPFPCSDPLWELLCEARKYYEISEGAFDVTITPLMQLWGFHRKRGSLPTEAEIVAALDDTATWYYKDPLTEHKLTLTSKTVDGTANLPFTLDACNVQYQVSDGAGGWSNVTLADTLGAGNYRVVISLKDTTNYTATDFTIEFEIQKFVVDIPDFDRTEEYDTAVWYPTGIPTSGNNTIWRI